MAALSMIFAAVSQAQVFHPRIAPSCHACCVLFMYAPNA